ncbi:MAG: hypothetical protein ACKORE_11200, partial [Bacteroidota bacterium]
FLLFLLFAAPSFGQSGTDSLLRETLTRAVAHWQDGRALNAFLALDSIHATALNQTNATTKTRGAYWTASYLLAQRKGRSAIAFTDSALSWSKRFGLLEEQTKVLSLKIQVSEALGDRSGAERSRELLSNLNDSLKVVPLQNTIDSLKSRLAALEKQPMNAGDEEQSDAGNGGKSSNGSTLWMLISALLTVTTVYFYRKSRNTHPPSYLPGSNVAPATVRSQQSSKADPGNTATGNRPKPASAPQNISPATNEPDVPLFIPVVQDQKPKTENTDSRNIHLPPAGTIPQETLQKLRGVELVLIKPEVLAGYRDGDVKAIRNLLNEFLAQLPFFMKTLDDAIAQNEIAPILLALGHVKDYLRQFGMASTEKLIDEVETESSTERISRLLSKVFQVRNHCRRAADETKSILANLN